MKILAWDIEASNLGADYGIVLCVGFKEVGKGQPEVLSINDYRGGNLIERERRLLIDVSERLLKADVWLTWFGTYFDIPFVNTRLLYHNLPVLPPTFNHIDGWKTAKNRLKLRNNRLNTVQEFLGTKTAKNAVLGPKWILALAGDRDALDYVVDHCRRDVQALDEVYRRLRPLVLDHPNRALLLGRGDCPVCAGKKLQARGFRITRTRKYKRYQCQDCGSWSTDTKPVAAVRG